MCSSKVKKNLDFYSFIGDYFTRPDAIQSKFNEKS